MSVGKELFLEWQDLVDKEETLLDFPDWLTVRLHQAEMDQYNKTHRQRQTRQKDRLVEDLDRNSR